MAGPWRTQVRPTPVKTRWCSSSERSEGLSLVEIERIVDLTAERHRDDALLRALAPDVRRRVGEIWRERAKSELGAWSGFAQVVVGLYSIGASPEVLALATQAAHEEVEHARACRALAELYLGEAVEMPRPKKVSMPVHRGATDPLRATLHARGLSGINETLAAEFVARCLDASEASAVREASQKHLRDEIGHARVGWAHLASGALDAADRAAIAEWMPRLVRANGELWLARVRTLPEEGVARHGYPPVRELEDGVRHALRTVVVPGLAHVGIDATGAARAVAALA